jgi:protease-4
MPLAKIDILRGMFKKLQEAGKTVITWAATYDTVGYYLASAADKVTLLTGGMLAPLGFYRQYIYLADALAKVGLKGDFLQTSPYKSAGDLFSCSEMSAEVREMGNRLADATYQEILMAVAAGRALDSETADSLLGQTPCTDLKAVELGAVDAILGEDDLPDYLQIGGKAAQLMPWSGAQKRVLRRPLKVPGPYIALLRVEGLIVDGRSNVPPVNPPLPIPLVLDERVGDISMINQIRQVMSDSRAVGTVLYVNSRGGSVTASESIRNALAKLAEMKPLVVVMGPVAGSGGYWVSTPGKTLLATPNTLTGSIGVILGKIADQGLLQRLLINVEIIRRGENIGIYAPDAPFTEAEREKLGDYLARVYDLFLDRVSQSREMCREEANAIGGGRVWTGRQAVENGLVDELGSLELGLAKIREMTGLSERSFVRIYEPQKGDLSPVSKSTSLFMFALQNLKVLNGKAACICPWVDI